MIALKENENEEITKEDIDLIQGYLTNWKNYKIKLSTLFQKNFIVKKIITSILLYFLMLSF